MQGRNQVIVIAGEPGVGKTRLGQEVTRDLLDHGFVISAGSCQEEQQGTPHFPFQALIAHLYDRAPPAVCRQMGSSLVYLRRLLPTVQIRGPEPISADRELGHLHSVVAEFVRAWAERVPVALLLDDLHWADATSLKLLLHLIRQTGGLRICILVTYRPMEVANNHPLQTVLRELNRNELMEPIEVPCLNRQETTELIAETLGREVVSAPFARLVYERTDGNPFFVRQLARVLTDGSAVLSLNGDARDLELAHVPDTIRATVIHRLERTPDDVQRVLRHASVLGQTFRFDDLLRMVEADEESLDDCLESGRRAGLISTVNGDVYAFDHALTQQSIYLELSPRRRRRLHTAAAVTIESSSEPKGGQRAVELAWHYLQADDPHRCLHYSFLAARDAESIGAYKDAERHFRTAAEVAVRCQDARSEAEAVQGLSRILFTTGWWLEGAAKTAERAADLSAAVGDVEGEAEAVASLAYSYGFRAQGFSGPEHSAKTATLAGRVATMRELMEAHGPSSTLGRLYQASSWFPLLEGKLAEASASIRRAVDIGRISGDRRLLSHALVDTFAVEKDGDDPVAAVEAVREAMAIAEEDADPAIRAFSCRNLADFYYLNHEADLEKAKAWLGRTIDRFERLGNWDGLAYSHARLAWALYLAGDWSGARRSLDDALSLLPEAGNNYGAKERLLVLAQLSIDEGRRSEAEAALHELDCLNRENTGHLFGRDAGLHAQLDLLRDNPESAIKRLARRQEHGPRLWSTEAEEVLALTELGRFEDAWCVAAEWLARTTAKRQRLPFLMALAHAARAACHALAWAQAQPLVEEALALARERGFPYEEGKLLYERGRHLGSRSDVQAARDIFTQLGAQPYAVRATRLLGVYVHQATRKHGEGER
jgi:tetratricopeptide (TPR) repeat protein